MQVRLKYQVERALGAWMQARFPVSAEGKALPAKGWETLKALKPYDPRLLKKFLNSEYSSPMASLVS